MCYWHSFLLYIFFLKHFMICREKFWYKGQIILCKIRKTEKKNPDYFFINSWPHQWLSGFVLKTGRRKLPGLNISRACRLRMFGVFLGFLRTSRKYTLRPLRKTPTEGTYPAGLSPRSGQLDLKPTS